MNPSIFKAYDIRGVYPKDVNSEVAEKIAAYAPEIFRKGRVVVGHDARIGSKKLYRTVISGLKKHGEIKCVEIGMATTPMFYFTVNDMGASGGIMITASHNPKNHNGFKIVGKKSKMISGLEIKKLIHA